MRLLPLLCLLCAPVQAEEIRLAGPPIFESAPLIAMAQSQPLADEGITFHFEPWSTPEELRQSLMREAPYIAVVPSLIAALYQARGIPVEPLSGVTSGGSLWLIGRGDAIETPADLDGARLSLPFQGHLPDLLMRRITQDTPDSFNPVYTGDFMAAMQLLLVSNADLALLPEPMASSLLAQAPDLTRRAEVCTLWRDATALEHCPAAGLVVANESAARPELLAAYEMAFDEIAAHPALASALLNQAFPFLPNGTEAAYAQISAERLNLPADRAALLDFYAEIFSIAPEALGGEMPGAEFLETEAE